MSDLAESILLGAVQGLTEFLPVSSSGHLAVLQNYFSFSGNRLFFDVMLHFATLLAVLVYFRKEILDYLRDGKKLLYVILATIPTGIVGLALKDHVEFLLLKPKIVACMFLVTAAIVFAVDKINGTKEVSRVGIVSILLVGLFQGMAVIPGISRSGSTIFASLLVGIKRSEAAPFSFIISIPAIAGATFLELVKGMQSASIDINLLAGMATAFVCGLLGLKLFVKMLTQKSFRYFSFYLLAIGLAIIVLG